MQHTRWRKTIRNLLRHFLRTARRFTRDAWRIASAVVARHQRATVQDRQIQKQRLRDTIKALTTLGNDNPSAAPAWRDFAAQLRMNLLERNPDFFLRWDVIADTMFVFDAAYIATELRCLRARRDWATRWRPVIREDAAGAPTPYLWYPHSSGNRIHHAYHLSVFETSTKTAVTDYDVIIEFGGGYGSLCRLAHKLGYKGTYIIHDLPELSALQTFYLGALGLRISDSVSGALTSKSIACCSDLAELLNVNVKKLPGTRVLFIATWSLSESPLETRESLKELCGSCTAHLIAYQHAFRGIDNASFFDRWAQSLRTFEWHHQEMSHLSGNSYLIGVQPGAIASRPHEGPQQ